MAVSLVSTGVTFPDNSTQTTAATGFGFKNRIINGAMVIDQRNAGASVTLTAANDVYPVDRLGAYASTDGTMTAQQSSTAPAGFTKSVVFTTTVADSSLGATQRCTAFQRIEGYNLADLGFGTASASTVTLSFWVRSSLTGTFGASLIGASYARSYPFNYTISAANTWEQKTVTIAGDTSGTWLTTNGVGLVVLFNLGSGSNYLGTANAWAAGELYAPTGSTSVIGTSGATFYITGVQLEKGSTATSFDYRPYGTELALCQRYTYVNRLSSSGGFGLSGFFETTTSAVITLRHPVEMRASPTFSFSAANTFFTQTTTNITPSAISLRDANTFGGVISATVSGATAGNGCHLVRNTGNGSETTITATAEL
jgi:hypothetical protein